MYLRKSQDFEAVLGILFVAKNRHHISERAGFFCTSFLLVVWWSLIQKGPGRKEKSGQHDVIVLAEEHYSVLKLTRFFFVGRVLLSSIIENSSDSKACFVVIAALVKKIGSHWTHWHSVVVSPAQCVDTLWHMSLAKKIHVHDETVR